MAIKITSKDLRHRISLCTSADVVTEEGQLMLVRSDVLSTWAKIEAKTTSMFSRAGYNILEDRNRQTHLAFMRMRRDIEISSAAWIFEQRMQSGARWFKILGIKEEDGTWIALSLRLIERGDDLVEPVSEPATEVPGFTVVSHGVEI
jgi:head-tail adaptor